MFKAEFGLTLSEEATIRYNPFTTHLTIEDFSLKNESNLAFQLDSLELEVRLHRLVLKQIYISEFVINGMFIAVDRNADSLWVAGIDVFKQSVQTDQSNENIAVGEPTEFALVAPKLELNDGSVELTMEGVIHGLKMNKVSVADVLLSIREQKLILDFNAGINEAPLNIDLSVALEDGQGTANTNLSLVQFNLASLTKHLPESVDALKGELTVSSDNTIRVSADSLIIHNPSTKLEVTDLFYKGDMASLLQTEVALLLSDLELKVDLNNPTQQTINVNINGIRLVGEGIDSQVDELKIKNASQLFDLNKISLTSDVQNGLNINIENASINLDETDGQQKHLLFSNEELSLDFNGIHFAKKPNENPTFGGYGKFAASQLVSYLDKQAHVLASVEQVKINKIEFKNGKPLALSFSNLSIVESTFSEITNDKKIPEVARLGSFDLNSFEFIDNVIKIKSISFDGFNGNIRLNEKSELSNLVPLDLLSVKESSINTEVESATENSQAVELSDRKIETSQDKTIAPLVKIDLVEFTNTKSVTFLDNGVSPSYKRELFIDEMRITDIDASKPLKESPFTMSGTSDRYTKFNFSGFVKPFTNKVNLKVKGSLIEISLPPASSYIQDVMGFQFESGELDTELDIEIIDSEISGTTGIKLRGFELAATENYNQDVVTEQTAMPLNVVLGLLKDGDGNVELDVPMLGNIDSPTFGYASFVALITKKAIQAAAQEYLIKTFIPYAEILDISISVGDFILKTRFEDLIYQPAQINISQEQTVFMQQFTELMLDKKDTQVKVCAIATVTDLLSASDKDLSEQQKIDKLKDISLSRMLAFEEYVVAKGVESSRVLTCSPKIDLTSGSTPKIVISV